MPNIAQQPVTVHRRLDCGIELAALPLADRRTVSLDMRFLVGFANEPQDKLGLNRTIEQVVSKGTEERTGKELSDAFDELGASWSSWAGREATGYQFTCLPEFVDRALELHAEFLRCPTFPEDAVQVANENSIKEITNLRDDPDDLLRDVEAYTEAGIQHLVLEPAQRDQDSWLRCTEALARLFGIVP